MSLFYWKDGNTVGMTILLAEKQAEQVLSIVSAVYYLFKSYPLFDEILYINVVLFLGRDSKYYYCTLKGMSFANHIAHLY